jgi:hypothetical protein
VIATIGYVIIVSLGDAAGARYRVPIIPLLALLAALGMQYSVRRLLRHWREPVTACEADLVTSSATASS